MAIPLPVLHDDETCMVFDKPAGLLTIPTDKNETRTLVSLANEQFPGQGQGGLHPAHRLDRDTSGAIMLARGKANQQRLMQLFKEKKVRKVYIAFVHGRLAQAEGKIRIPIKDFFQRKFDRQSPAQSALTHYRVKGYHKNFTEVEVMPVTGRTNQIRIHFAKIGHPIVGEDKYAFRKDFELRFRRTALHAFFLQWPHPVTGKLMSAQAPLPSDMEKFLLNHEGGHDQWKPKQSAP